MATASTIDGSSSTTRILPLPSASFMPRTLARLPVNRLGKCRESDPQHPPSDAEGRSNAGGCIVVPEPGTSPVERKEQRCSARSRRSDSASPPSAEPPSAEPQSPAPQRPTPAPTTAPLRGLRQATARAAEHARAGHGRARGPRAGGHRRGGGEGASGRGQGRRRRHRRRRHHRLLRQRLRGDGDEVRRQQGRDPPRQLVRRAWPSRRPRSELRRRCPAGTTEPPLETKARQRRAFLLRA